MTDEKLTQLIFYKLKTYRLFDDTWQEKKRIINLTYSGKHILIEYASDFRLQEWLAHLMQCNYFVCFEPKYYGKIFKNEYDFSIRECEWRYSLHVSHDGNVKAAYHIDHYSPQYNSLYHLIYDVILNWS